MAASIPSTQRALLVQGPGSVQLTNSCPVPKPAEDQVLVRVVCVAINPHDWKSIDMSPSPGSIWGSDLSGIVVSVGSMLQDDLAAGDRVAGLSPGNNRDVDHTGAFTEYALVPRAQLFKIPPSMSFEEAATLGIGMSTVGILYHVTKLPLPIPSPLGPPASAEPRQFVLVYGGGTATGTLAIQAIKLSGMSPITICSPSHFTRVQSLGAVKAFDYHSPNCAADVRAYTKDSLKYVWDCITDSGSMKICYDAIGSGGGRYVGLDQFPIRGHTRRNIKPDWILALTLLGKPVSMKKPYYREVKPKDAAFFRDIWAPLTQKLVDAGVIIPHPLEVSDEGLNGLAAGADRVRKGQARGRKLVYRIAAA